MKPKQYYIHCMSKSHNRLFNSQHHTIFINHKVTTIRALTGIEIADNNILFVNESK